MELIVDLEKLVKHDGGRSISVEQREKGATVGVYFFGKQGEDYSAQELFAEFCERQGITSYNELETEGEKCFRVIDAGTYQSFPCNKEEVAMLGHKIVFPRTKYFYWLPINKNKDY